MGPATRYPYHLELSGVWVAIIIAMILAPYWLGPIKIKLTQTRPAAPKLMELVGDTGTLPSALAAFVAETQRSLSALGFGHLVVLRQAAGVVVLGDLEPATVATGLAIVKKNGELHALVGFTTQLRGVKLRTSNSPLAAITPAPAGESRVRLPGERNAARLYAIHASRIARARAEGTAADRLTVGDPVAYQQREEASSLAQAVSSGYWMRRGDRLAPTWRGAFLSAWRLLPPWRDLTVRRDERIARSLVARSA